MNDKEIKRLKYRRQYFLGLHGMKCPFMNNTKKLNSKYVLYTHIDLIVTEYIEGDKKLVLLGDIYDFENVNKKNFEILKDLVKNDFNDIIEKTSIYSGRYVIIYCNNDEIKLMHDATASRKIFYTKKDGVVLCASTQHLLAEVSGFNITTNPSLLEYYQSEKFIENLNFDIGYYTYYDEIRQVLPNHYLNIDPFEIKRFWPDKEPESFSREECVILSAKMIKGFITAASKRYKLMIPITAGYDSRVILAATNGISDKMFYYLNDSDEVKKSADYRVSKKMLARYNIKINLLNIDKHVDEKFREVYFQNNPLANKEYLPIIYNYYKHHSEKLNLPGNIIPIVKALHHFSTTEITPELLARSYNNDKLEIAHTFYRDWFDQTKEIADRFRISIFDLLFWEDFTCNKVTQVQLDKDIAQEEFTPFNSRSLILTMLAYEETRRQKPYLIFHKEIIKTLWSDLLDFPFNPSFNQKVKQMLIFLKLYKPVLIMKRKLLGELY